MVRERPFGLAEISFRSTRDPCTVVPLPRLCQLCPSRLVQTPSDTLLRYTRAIWINTTVSRGHPGHHPSLPADPTRGLPAMPPRSSSALYASAASPIQESYGPISPSENLRYNDVPPSHRPSRAAWVDPASLSNCGEVSHIGGNVSSHVKQLILNTYMAYGAGDENCFGHAVAKAVKFVDVNVSKSEEKQGRMEATTVAEVIVTKNMLNGAGMLHGGCMAFLIDKYACLGLNSLEHRSLTSFPSCCSTPLVALGLLRNMNGVGVTQAMNVMFHSPAPP